MGVIPFLICYRRALSMLPKLSLVVPSYNAAETIERTIDSILRQNYENLEIICVDGESPDGTAKLLERYGDKISHIICEPDRCQADALNKGFKQVTGEIYGWLCADDELADEALDYVGRYFADNVNVKILTGGCSRRFDDGSSYETTPDTAFYADLFLKNTIEQPSTFWRKEVHHSAGPLSEKLKYAFDWEYWCRMRRIGFEMQSTDKILSIYYFSDSNLTSTGGTKIANEMYSIVREYGPFKGRIAWAYKFLYTAFDLRGYYDAESDHANIRKYFFHVNLRLLYLLFDRDSINKYNWNFASRQERGLGW